MKNISKAAFSVAAAAAIAGASIIPATSVFAWGDNGGGRRGYTIEEINNNILGDKIVLNSITNATGHDKNGKTIQLGDERNFLRARANGAEYGSLWSANEIIVESGKEYVVRLYVHNNNLHGTDAVAKDVNVSLAIPGDIANEIKVEGYISSSNATPSEYWDYVTFKSQNGERFHLEYVPGSSFWESNGKSNGALSDNFITKGGVKVGYDSLNGEIPGCYQYSGYASARVKVVYDETFEITKQVRIKGTKEWSETVDAKVGDIVEFMIGYKNKSGKEAKDVMVLDSLPNNLQYVPNTTMLKNANHPNAVKVTTDTLTTTGINIGSYANEANAYVLFEAKVIDKTLDCNKRTQMINWVKITANGETRQDSASVLTDKVCGQKELPKTGSDFVPTAIIGAGSITTALGYFIVSRKK